MIRGCDEPFTDPAARLTCIQAHVSCNVRRAGLDQTCQQGIPVAVKNNAQQRDDTKPNSIL